MQVRPPSLGNGKNVPVEGMKGVGGEEVPKGGESWLAVEKIPGGVQRAARNSGEYGRWEGRVRFGCFDRSLLGGQRERPATQGSVGKGLRWSCQSPGPSLPPYAPLASAGWQAGQPWGQDKWKAPLGWAGAEAAARTVLEPLWLGQRRCLERLGGGYRAGPSSRLEEPVYLLPGVGEEPADWSVSNPVI